jgi:hypothetical protein
VPFYVETCFLLTLGNVSVFYYNDNGLDGMCGCRSIWRRWGRYQKEGLENGLFYLLKLSFLCSYQDYQCCITSYINDKFGKVETPLAQGCLWLLPKVGLMLTENEYFIGEM